MKYNLGIIMILYLLLFDCCELAKIFVGWPQHQYGYAVCWVSQNGQ